MNLTPQQRHDFIKGDCPTISGTGICPVKPGHVWQVAKDLEVHVTKVAGKPDKWHLLYTVKDKRHQVRNLRRTPPTRPAEFGDDFDELGYPHPPTPDTIAQAAEESAYTTGPSSVDECGEAVDPKSQAEFTAAASLRNLERRVKSAGKGQDLPLEMQLAEIVAEARSKGVDVTGEIRVIRKRIEAMRRKVVHGQQAA